MILEVYDVDRILVITTDRIKITKESSNCKIDLPDEILRKALSRSEYDQKAQEIIRQQSSRLQSLCQETFILSIQNVKIVRKGWKYLNKRRKLILF